MTDKLTIGRVDGKWGIFLGAYLVAKRPTETEAKEAAENKMLIDDLTLQLAERLNKSNVLR